MERERQTGLNKSGIQPAFSVSEQFIIIEARCSKKRTKETRKEERKRKRGGKAEGRKNKDEQK